MHFFIHSLFIHFSNLSIDIHMVERKILFGYFMIQAKKEQKIFENSSKSFYIIILNYKIHINYYSKIKQKYH